MALISVEMPIAQTPGGSNAPTCVSFTASSHVHDSDFVVLSGGTIAPAGANVAGGIAGIAQHDSNSAYGGTTAGSGPVVAPIQNVFGLSEVGTLLPPSPGQTIVAALGLPVVVAINLTATTGWQSGGSQQATYATAVGLAIDSTTGYYLADPTASNKVAVVTGKINGPSFGGVGDLGARVLIEMNASALAIQEGM